MDTAGQYIHVSSIMSMILLPVGTYVIQIPKDQVYYVLLQDNAHIHIYACRKTCCYPLLLIAITSE